ncbi:hypothetical protein DS843_21975 [Roseomonas genomospecies 6]|uniref:Uncharacterized protein n=1 Tax=Roseomonas genomospecies 6 TaxID=214106 RepID=A0A9W7KQM7_9PROT|nr:hypothetical protein DS843_21975 [Roseomonas genomospecies 6]
MTEIVEELNRQDYRHRVIGSVRRNFPELFSSPFADLERDLDIFVKGLGPSGINIHTAKAAVLDAQKHRKLRKKERDRREAERASERPAGWQTFTIVESEREAARVALMAWLTPADTPFKRQHQHRVDELTLLWCAWTLTSRRLGRAPKQREFGETLKEIGGAEFVKSRSAEQNRFEKMRDTLTAPGGPWNV